MTIQSRQTVRQRLAAELETVHGSSVFKVYSFMSTAWEGKSPVIRVMNGGSFRPRRAGTGAPLRPTGGAGESRFRYLVQHFVRYDDAEDHSDQEGSEDQLDALETVMAQFMSDFDQLPGVWKSIEMADYSEPALVKVGAFQYLLEAFLVELKIDG